MYGVYPLFIRVIRRMFAIPVLLLIGCAPVPPQQDAAVSAPAQATVDPAEEIQRRIDADAARRAQEKFDQPVEALLQRAMKFYDSGRYLAAINTINSSSSWKQSSPTLQIRGWKVLAFSYCTLQKEAHCRKAFDEILVLNPDFKLLPLEAGNPNWDPIFREAQAAMAAMSGGK